MTTTSDKHHGIPDAPGPDYVLDPERDEFDHEHIFYSAYDSDDDFANYLYDYCHVCGRRELNY